MSDNEQVLYRNAGTGEIVTKEYAEANPKTTIRETIEMNRDVEEDIARLHALPDLDDDGKPPVFHPILQIWRVILEPAEAESKKRITPQWASRVTASYQQLTFADMPRFSKSFYAKLARLLEILNDEIATDDECLNTTTPEEDLEQNAQHYKALMFDWQKEFLAWELAWETTDKDAAVELAAISEVHNMVFSQTGIVNQLGNIKFEFTEADQQELASELEAMKEAQ